MSGAGLARRAVGRAVRTPAVNRAVRAIAGARGHRLALVYHRVGPPSPQGSEVVPSVPADTLRAHLRALDEVVDLVTVDEVLAGGEGRRPKVAVTFDDDLPSHVTEALPILRALGVPATFFLSGRTLHGLGPYWFQHLEALLEAHGVDRTASLLGIPAVRSGDLALACEQDAGARRRVTELAADLPEPELLDAEGIAALADAMTVGFHTVDHCVLPTMDDGALADAVTRGRDTLATVAGASLRHFAYPHGKADARSADVVRRAGFDTGWTGRPAPLRAGDDPHRLGRWEPGRLGVGDLLGVLAIRLHRAAPAPRGASA